MKQPYLRTFGVLLFSMTLIGCGSFDKDFEELASQPPPHDVSGAWIGTWQNSNNTHNGDLRAIVIESAPGVYYVTYKAKYGAFMTFTHDVILRGSTTGSTVHFEGEEDLGWLAGGAYSFSGYATSREFFSSYTSKNDEGTYTMRRPLIVHE